jgi:phosphoglycerate dehydrogenase-like enzyme
LPTSKGPPSSLVELRTAVWTGVTRDTMPLPNVLCTCHLGWVEWTNFEPYFRESFKQIVAYQQAFPM